MSKKMYTDEQVRELKENKYIRNCSNIYLSFTNEAKVKAIALWNSGLNSNEVFRALELPEYIIKSKIPTKSMVRWRRIVLEKWINVLSLSQKWWKKGAKTNKCDTDIKKLTKDQRINYLETKIAYLEQANNVLEWVKKKILTKSKKFSIIYWLSSKYNINILCFLAWVSISWYYAYKIRVKKGITQEDREKKDYEIIEELVLKWRRRDWYRTITMKLYKEWVKMNHKKVHRIMRKYNLLSRVRKLNPYKNIFKATTEHRKVENILNREFRWLEPFKKLWTDISYIRYNNSYLYLSVVKDMVSWEILSDYLWTNLSMDLINKTINKLHILKNKKNISFDWCIIHSDQWTHYTHPIFSSWVKELWLIQSMSRRWNCLDNAPTESFFWHMKDELDLSWCKSVDEAKEHMSNYIFYYNNSRPQWNRNKMTPVAYRKHLLSKINNTNTTSLHSF